MKRWIILLLFSGVAVVTQAGTYKCEVDGRVVYQQSPCTTQGEEMDIKDTRSPEVVVDNETVEQSQAAMNEIMVRFNQQYNIAASTGRITLAVPLQELQELRNEAASMEVIPCHEKAHQHMLKGMEHMVEAYSAYQAGRAWRDHYDDAVLEFRVFRMSQHRPCQQ